MIYEQQSTPDGGICITVEFPAEEINQLGVDPLVLMQVASASMQSLVSKKLLALGLLAENFESIKGKP